MILDSFTQDIRVGLRVLLKDKVFCLLAILVPALGSGLTLALERCLALRALALLEMLLHSASDDVVFGITVSGRPYDLPQVESLFGSEAPFFSRTPASPHVVSGLRRMSSDHVGSLPAAGIALTPEVVANEFVGSIGS